MTMIFKIAEAADMNELAALYSSLWGSPGSGWDEEYPTAEDISEDISNQDLIIAVRGGSIIGAIAVAGDRGDSHDDSNDSVLFDKRIKRPCDLARIAVKPGLQGKGVGRALLDHAQMNAAHRGFDGVVFYVGRKNERALALYDSCGFRRAGEETRWDMEWFVYDKYFDNEAIELFSSRKRLKALQEKMSAYTHAMEAITYDGATSAPKGTAANRAHALGILSGEYYELATGDETAKLLDFLYSRRELLPRAERRQIELLLKEIHRIRSIPQDEYMEYERLVSESDDIWHTAKETNDFELFRPYLERIVDFTRRFASYAAPDRDPYDYWLSEYEEGLTKEKCEEFFSALREGLVPLIKSISHASQFDDDCLHGDFDDSEQENLARFLMDTMLIDTAHCGLATTEHPFTTSLGSHHDERITTNYDRHNFSSSMFSVIHEGGHALYDMGSDESFAYTVLDGGVSMGIHESQSRFYENLLARSKAFISFLSPKLREFIPALAEVDSDMLYRAVNRVQPSLIRTEADEVTYCLHVMVRYEIEKRLMDGSLEVRDIPGEWNRLYKEYLGVDVPDDRRGCLQDSHWAGGAIGYFPSYALGSAYGAQLLDKMMQELDVDKMMKNGDFKEINEWLRSRIWRFGCLCKPGELLEQALGKPFDPSHYISYLTHKYGELYGLSL